MYERTEQLSSTSVRKVNLFSKYTEEISDLKKTSILSLPPYCIGFFIIHQSIKNTSLVLKI